MPHDGADNPTEPTPEPSPTPGRTPLTPSSETQPAKEKKGKKHRPEPTTAGGKLWHNWIKPVGSVIIVVVLLRSTLIDWNDVPTGSMEPEIQVGDRIAVNRLAYALQAPLSGPKIGIPFTPLQWDNPLDGIPQWQWAEPDRGDIVTFWNPVTGVRMVKRIVAVPGDTIEMAGGRMTINGTAATYQDLTTTPPRQTKYHDPNPLGGKPITVTKPLEDLEETLLGETRMVQHIKERWLDQVRIVVGPNGDRKTLTGATVTANGPNGSQVNLPVSRFLQMNPQLRVIAEIRDGRPFIAGQPVNHNAFATMMLEPFTAGAPDEVLGDIGLGIVGHTFQIDGKAVPFEYFKIALEGQSATLNKNNQAVLAPLGQTLGLLQQLTMTSFGPVTLGKDEYFMVGDNRNNSHDSRYFGPVMLSEITGEAFAVAFSFRDNKMFALPPDPDLSRFFKDLD